MTSRKSASSSPHDALLEFEYANIARARLIEHSLRPEVGDIGDERAQVTLTRDGTALELAVEATDLVALRAGLNTWLSLASVAEQAGTPPTERH